MKKARAFLLFPLLLLISYCSQSQPYHIIKSWAFFRTSIAGAVQTEDNGTPTNAATKEYLIYIETKRTTFHQWQTAYIDGLPYSIHAVEITDTPIKLGMLKGQKKATIINKEKNNRLWQIIITPELATDQREPSLGTKAITLSGIFKGKAFTYRIKNVQELSKRFRP